MTGNMKSCDLHFTVIPLVPIHSKELQRTILVLSRRSFSMKTASPKSDISEVTTLKASFTYSQNFAIDWPLLLLSSLSLLSFFSFTCSSSSPSLSFPVAPLTPLPPYLVPFPPSPFPVYSLPSPALLCFFSASYFSSSRYLSTSSSSFNISFFSR